MMCSRFLFFGLAFTLWCLINGESKQQGGGDFDEYLNFNNIVKIHIHSIFIFLRKAFFLDDSCEIHIIKILVCRKKNAFDQRSFWILSKQPQITKLEIILIIWIFVIRILVGCGLTKKYHHIISIPVKQHSKLMSLSNSG